MHGNWWGSDRYESKREYLISNQKLFAIIAYMFQLSLAFLCSINEIRNNSRCNYSLTLNILLLTLSFTTVSKISPPRYTIIHEIICMRTRPCASTLARFCAGRARGGGYNFYIAYFNLAGFEWAIKRWDMAEWSPARKCLIMCAKYWSANAPR